jgi:tetratricopeptide (TPR) repeat protein
MTSTVTMSRADTRPGRAVELVLAHAHLRLGSLALARTELETLAGLGKLDTTGLVDLAEVRWRTGDLTGAGEAARAALRANEEHPVALLIAAEAAASLGRPSEARRLASQSMASAGGSIDVILAGMPRSAAWPADADEPPPIAPTLFDREPERAVHAEGVAPATDQPPPKPTATPVAPVTRGFWDEDKTEEAGAPVLPDPALELEAARSALVAGSFDDAALRFGLALRLAPSLAPAVLEATAGARVATLIMVRGDAYRLAGHEMEAREAYAVAARGGLPERRRHPRGAALRAGVPTIQAAAPPPDGQLDGALERAVVGGAGDPPAGTSDEPPA